jgi:hypothetical protein
MSNGITPKRRLWAASLFWVFLAQAQQVRLDCLGETSCRAFVAAADGAVYLAGKALAGVPNVGCAAANIERVYLARMRPGVEAPEWIECFERDNPSAMAASADGTLVLTGFDGRQGAWVMKYDPAKRKVVFFTRGGPPNSLATDLAPARDGGWWVAGVVGLGGFVAKLSADGQRWDVWQDWADAIRKIGAGADGRPAILIRGGTIFQLENDGLTVAWTQTLENAYAAALAVEGDGSVWAAGQTGTLGFATTENAVQREPATSALKRYDRGYWFGHLRGLAVTSIQALAMDPKARATVWAATTEGVYRSDTNGWLWERRSTGLPEGSVVSIAVDPSNGHRLFVSLPGGVYRSEDDGIAWQITAENVGVRALAVDPADPKVVYAAGDGLWKSEDGARSWRKITACNCTSIAVDPSASQRLLAVSSLVAQGFPISVSYAAILTSEDGGSTWANQVVQAPARGVVFDPADPRRAFFLAANQVMRSTDGGRNWEGAANLAGPAALAFDPEDPGALLALAMGGWVLRSTDDGGSFQGISVNAEMAQLSVLAVGEGSVYIAGGAIGNSAWIRKYTAQGELSLSTLWSAGLDNSALALAPRTAGGAAATGLTDRAAFFAEFDAAGQPVRSSVLDVGYAGYGTGLQQTLDGRWWMGAWTVFQDGRSQRSVMVVPQ